MREVFVVGPVDRLAEVRTRCRGRGLWPAQALSDETDAVVRVQGPDPDGVAQAAVDFAPVWDVQVIELGSHFAGSVIGYENLDAFILQEN